MRREAFGQEFAIFFGDGGEAPPPYVLEGDAAVLCIEGPLTQHAMFFWDSYDAIRERAKAAFACPEARRVIAKINSPGGEAAGCFELARELRAMARAAGKEFIAFVDTRAASAAYALASAADRIVVQQSADVGSVGVVQALLDTTAQDRMFGVSWTWITSGERKLDGNPHAGVTDSAITAGREAVEQLAGMFFALLEEHRGMPPAKSKALDGALLIGVKAVASGLADQVSTWTELIAGAAAPTSPPGETTMSKYDEAMGALKRAAEADDEDGKKAKKALKAIEDGEKEPDGDEGNRAEGDKPPPDDEKDKKDKEARAAAAAAASTASASASSSPELIAITRELHAMKAERAAEKEAAQRAQLLATRPDFSDTVRATLAKAPMAVLEDAVKTWPKIASRAAALAGAAGGSMVTGTRGESQNGDGGSTLSPADAADLDRRMGLRAETGGVKREGRHFEIGVVSPEAARAHLAKKVPGAPLPGNGNGAALAAEDLDS